MGRVKYHFWEEIEQQRLERDGFEPDDLEMLRIDAERAQERYEEAARKHERDIRNGKPV